MKKFDHNEQQLFAQIAVDIKKHPQNYRDAGKWFDKECSENAYLQCKRNELKKLEKILPEDVFVRRENELKRPPPLTIRVREVYNQLLKKYEEQQFLKGPHLMPSDDARRIILLTWILTDADAEKTNLGITQLEKKWPWESTDAFPSFLSRKYFHIDEDWIKLARIAWPKLDSLKPEETEQKKKGILKRLLKIIGAIVGFLAALFTCLGYLLGWLGPIKAFIGKILWPK